MNLLTAGFTPQQFGPWESQPRLTDPFAGGPAQQGPGMGWS